MNKVWILWYTGRHSWNDDRYVFSVHATWQGAETVLRSMPENQQQNYEIDWEELHD